MSGIWINKENINDSHLRITECHLKHYQIRPHTESIDLTGLQVKSSSKRAEVIAVHGKQINIVCAGGNAGSVACGEQNRCSDGWVRGSVLL